MNDDEGTLRDAVSALRINLNYVNAQDFVVTYFKAAVKTRQNKLQRLETSSDKFRYDSDRRGVLRTG